MTRKPVVYLAGPMTGYHLWNFPAFFRAEAQLAELGAVVINPAQHDIDNGFDPQADPGTYTPADLHAAMAWDLSRVLDRETDAVVFLPGSAESSGATLEMRVARAIGKPVMSLREALLRLKLNGTLDDSRH